MQLARALPVGLDWRWVLMAFALALLVMFNVQKVALMLLDPPPRWDWINLSAAVERSDPYSVGVGYRWSPVAHWLLVPVIAGGWWLFSAAHFAALTLIRDRRVVAVALLSWPFWVDVMFGNVLTFVFVAAWLALSGNRYATWAFYALTVLIPRPLMFPVAVYLLWKQPESRVPLAVIFVAHALLVVWSGLGDEWIGRLLVANEMEHVANFALSRFIGSWWIPIGLALAAWLTWKGWLGLASVAAQPYLLPYYFLMLGLELRAMPWFRRHRRFARFLWFR